MGWFFTYDASRRDIINDCLRPWKSYGGSNRAVAHCTRGNVLWIVWETYYRSTGHFGRVILCILLQRSSDGWGYKDMDESVHPYYYSCPLKYLNMGTTVLSPGWREGVREYHKRRAEAREKRKQAKL